MKSKPHGAALLLAAIALTSCAAHVPADRGGSIAGAIRLGDQPIPPLRICALPREGEGAAHCLRTQGGVRTYRIDGLPGGRYHVLAWPLAGELRLIAHATSIRCIRAPCPPDRLRDVELPAGAQLDGIDLDVPYTDVPVGWPPQPRG